MLPFCGYNMADYVARWLKIGERGDAALPKFYVKWFRKDADGKFLWPGFGENSRVLEWIVRRCDGQAEAVETPIGNVPAEGELNLEGLEISPDAIRELITVDTANLRDKLPRVREHLAKFGDRLPAALHDQLAALAARLNTA